MAGDNAKRFANIKHKRLDLGCGAQKKEGFAGVDRLALPGVDVVLDLLEFPWPWETNSIEESYCSHFVEHLTNFNDRWERVKFFNELYRVTKPGGLCTLIFPHWSSNRFYGDPTHKEPLSEMTFYYLDPKWREREAPHTDARNVAGMYDCDWDCSWGYGMHPEILARSDEYRKHAMAWYRDALIDMHVTMKARK